MSVARATLVPDREEDLVTSQPLFTLGTSKPVAPQHLLTVAEYLEIGEIEPGYSELVEGRLLMSPSPGYPHGRATGELYVQMHSQVPPDLEVLLDMDVDLQLAPADKPGTVRRPDLIVIPREAGRRMRREGGVLRASEVMIAVEILSPSSRRTDNVHKRNDYAEAGIPHYWILDVTEPISLLVCHLAGEFGYADGGAVTGRFITTEPFDLEIDLDALL
jgi:Uma2 family endonuclease